MQRIHKFYITCLLVLLMFTPLIIFEATQPKAFVSAQGGTTVFTNVRVTQDLRMQPRTAISVTMNGTIDPTGSFQRLESAGAVSVSGDSVDVEPAGTILVLANVGGSTITITETASLISAGNVALGAGDTATFISDGDAWRQIAASNN